MSIKFNPWKLVDNITYMVFNQQYIVPSNGNNEDVKSMWTYESHIFLCSFKHF